MTNIEGAYTLTELCAELALSPSWVKKMEGHLDLSSWGSGQRGKKSFYSAHQFEFFRKISILRSLGFGLEDIRSLFDKEMNILNMVMDNFPGDEAEVETDVKPISLYLLTNIYSGPTGVEIDSKKYDMLKSQKQEDAVKLQGMVDDYNKVVKGILAALKNMFGHMEEELKYLQTWG